MNKSIAKIALVVLLPLGLLSGLIGGLSRPVSAVLARAPNPAPAEAVAAFLFPPYPGTASEESLFDHTSPNYTDTDVRMVVYNGDEARKYCPNPAPPGTPPPGGTCDLGYGIYWSYSAGDWIAYNGHDGIDFGINYRPVYAAADSDQVMYAGWNDPQNHRYGLGLYVRLHHPNGYSTWYGHMSALAVQSCSGVGCADLAHGEMIGISGNTGNSTGPHLHLRVMDPIGRPIDPYGWTGSGLDPWPYNQGESLWVQYPSLTVYSGTLILPSGPALDYPPPVSGGLIVDDGDSAYTESPLECWNDINTAAGQAQNNDMRYHKPSTSSTCTARWNLPSGSENGMYAVYIRIPAVHATSEAAVYTIQHAGRADPVVINQAVYPNRFYVTDGWVYVGKYNFLGAGNEYVYLSNKTQDESGSLSTLEVGVDAVKFVFLGQITPTPTGPTPTPSLTSTPTQTGTATQTFTPSTTPSPTNTRTPSSTPVVRPTDTRWPTATPPYTLLYVYFVNRYRLAAGTPPYEVVGLRYAKSSEDFPAYVLGQYFKGPGYTEYLRGYSSVTNGFTGFNQLQIENGVARVYLTGKCQSPGPSYSVADAIKYNLLRFSQVQFVKIYDENGSTQNPDGQSDSLPLCLDPSFIPTPTETPTTTPTRTPTPTRTVRPTATRWPTATPGYYRYTLYFANRYRYAAGTPPFEATGTRYLRSSFDQASAILDEYFKGPGAIERLWGYISLYNGFDGYSNVEVADGVARVYLTGACQYEGRDFTIADLLAENLRQLPDVQVVKVYDQAGTTVDPDGPNDSRPVCLLGLPTVTPTVISPTPSLTPVPVITYTLTPATPITPETPSATPSLTATLPPGVTPTDTRIPTRTVRPTDTRWPTNPPRPTDTRWPTATPPYTKLSVYFTDQNCLTSDSAPCEVAVDRWVKSSFNLPVAVLDQFFNGPGASERRRGLIAVTSGFSGYSQFEFADGVARVYLRGICNSNGATYTIANPLMVNLKQFQEIQFVKLYDENGATENPDGQGDSLPACLQP